MLTFTIIAPRHRHDCSACTFVGFDGAADIYRSCEGSVLRRYSDDEADYSSFPLDLAVQIPDYSAAVALIANFKPLQG